MKRILITGSVQGANSEKQELYRAMVDVCNSHADIVESPLDTMEFTGTNEERYDRAVSMVKNSDLLIAEVSTASTGQGMEIQMAVANGTKVIAVASESSSVSGLVKGCLGTIVRYTSPASLKESIAAALNSCR